MKNSNEPDVILKEDVSRRCLMDYKVVYDDAIKLKRSSELDEDERISLVSDNMFKAMFLNETRKKFPCKFLSYFLNVEYESLIENLEYYKNDINKRSVSSKSEVADFVAKIGNTFISIEMNNRNTLERNEDYANRLSAVDLKTGKEYKYYIVVQINVNNFYFEGHEKAFMVFRNMNEDGELYTRKVYVEIFLPILRKKMYNKGIETLSEKERVILALYESSKSKALELSKGDKELMEYYEEEAKAERNEDLISAYDHEVENYKAGVEQGFEDGLARGRALGLEQGIKEGLEQGIKEGLEQGIKEGLEQGEKSKTLELAKNFLKAGIDIKIIQASTNLSLEELENMKKELS